MIPGPLSYRDFRETGPWPEITDPGTRGILITQSVDKQLQTNKFLEKRTVERTSEKKVLFSMCLHILHHAHNHEKNEQNSLPASLTGPVVFLITVLCCVLQRFKTNDGAENSNSPRLLPSGLIALIICKAPTG